MPYFLGLDLGQTTDHSASIILEAIGEGDERTYDCRHIQQYPLQMSYPRIVQLIGALMDRPPLARDCTLVIDATGVGRPIFDLFVNELRQPIGITITGGTTWHIEPESRYQWHVAKIQLVGTVQRLLQSGRLRIGATLEHAHLLQSELRNFRVKLSKSANETYSSREGAHDDLVLSLAIAAFCAEHHTRGIDISPAEIAKIQREAGIAPKPRRRLPMSRRYW